MLRYVLASQLVRYLFRFRIVRYGLIGGICIPVHLLSLAAFLYLFGEKLYLLALVCTFEVSTTINFVLKQSFTYHEQQYLSLSGWVKRALKGQLTSLTSQMITFCVAVTFTYGLHQTPYLGSFVGIVSAFFLNYSLSKRFVFQSIPVLKPMDNMYNDGVQHSMLDVTLRSDESKLLNTKIALNTAHRISDRRSLRAIRPIRLQRWADDEVSDSIFNSEKESLTFSVIASRLEPR